MRSLALASGGNRRQVCNRRLRSAKRSDALQWQGHFPPQPPDEVELSAVALDFVSPPDSVLASDLASRLAAPSPFLASVVAGLPLPLKSVAYQPPPLRWNPTGEISLESAGLLHCGQSDSGGSESFCSTSSSCPQAPQRYS